MSAPGKAAASQTAGFQSQFALLLFQLIRNIKASCSLTNTVIFASKHIAITSASKCKGFLKHPHSRCKRYHQGSFGVLCVFLCVLCVRLSITSESAPGPQKCDKTKRNTMPTTPQHARQPIAAPTSTELHPPP